MLAAAHGRALGRDGVRMSVFTSDLFTTGHDAANRAAVRAVRTADLDLVGLAGAAQRGGPGGQGRGDASVRRGCGDASVKP
ncbi:DUF2000 family protein [Actinoplanes hulinensis]|uniref:DUF2000 family protein n=1 Tax=Actinoplanes hulinensis TaxID=1144547 RepID=UPI00355716E0